MLGLEKLRIKIHAYIDAWMTSIEGTNLWALIKTVNFTIFVALMALFVFHPLVLFAFLMSINPIGDLMVNLFHYAILLLDIVLTMALGATVAYIREKSPATSKEPQP